MTYRLKNLVPIHTYIYSYIHSHRNNVRFVELIAALKILDMPEQSVYDKLKMVCAYVLHTHINMQVH